MIFYLSRCLKKKIKIDEDRYDLLAESKRDVETYKLDDEEEDLMDKYLIDPTDKLCESLLDIGDYEFYNVEKCKLINKW